MKTRCLLAFACLCLLACLPDHDDQPVGAGAGAGLRPVPLPDSLFQLASHQLDSLKYQTALENFRLAEPLYLQGENWEKLIACRRSQAYCLWWSHRSDEAVALCEQTLPDAKQRLGDSHPEVAKLYTILGNVHADKRTEKDFRLCLDYFQKALDATRLHFGDPHPALADCYERFGIAYFLADDYAKGINFYEKALTYLEPPSQENSGAYTKIYNNLGLNYNGMGLYARSRECFENALRINEEVRKIKDSRSVMFLKNLAYAQLQLGDFDEALLTFEQALALQKQVGEPGSKLEAYLLNGIGDCWKAAGDFAKARSFYEQCLPFWTTGKRDDVHGLQIELQNLGELSLLQNDPAAALRYFHEAWQTIDSVYDAENYSRVAPLVKLGKAHARSGNAAAALDAWNGALRIALKTVGQRHPVPGEIRQLVAELHFKKGDLGDARRWAQDALQSFAGAGINEIPLAQPGGKFSQPQLSQVSDWSATASLLTLFGDLSQEWNLTPWLAPSPGNEKEVALRRALGFYRASLALSDSLKLSLTSQVARQETQKKIALLAEKAIACAHRLHEQTGDDAWLAEAFVFFEKSRSAQLTASLREDQAATVADIPAEVLRREQWLKSQCAHLRQRWQNPDPAATGAVHPQHWQAQYFQARRQLDSLVGSLEKNYPDYFRRKYDLGVACLEAAGQQAKAKNAVLLEFFWGDSSVYLLAVPPTGPPRLTRLGAPDTLEHLLSTLRKNLHDYQPGWKSDEQKRQDFQAFCRAALALHDRLRISEIEASDIVIAPDGLLNYLPFAALLDRQPAAEALARLDWRRLPYLMRSHAIHLVPSATLWLENAAATGHGSYVGFAPTYENETLLATAARRSDSLRLERNWGGEAGEALPPLLFNRQEVEQTAALAVGKTHLGAAATEENFKKNAPGAAILHCAMHALTSDADPQHAALIFAAPSPNSDPSRMRKKVVGTSPEDGKLHAWEICNLRLQADLAVLSACNTGAGRLMRGEGAMSLAHAFQFAGCRSVMMSLWRANDAATQEVTVGFFQRLKTGERKSEALRQSVLQFLSEAKNDEQAHPSCWANFVVSGSDAPVVLKAGVAQKGWWVAALLLLAGGFWLFQKARRARMFHAKDGK